jgi:DNA gyrase subunit A
VVISNRGFIKRVPVSAYRNQGRGGKGASSASLKNDDFVENLFVASTHDHILFISSFGKAYWMKVHEIPEGGRTARGQHIKSLLSVGADEDITTVLPIAEFTDDSYIFMSTGRGVVKKVTTTAFMNARTRGIIAIKLDVNDKLISAHLTSGSDEVVLVTRRGNALRINEEQVRAMGRSSRGVRGIRLSDGDELAGALCVNDQEQMLLLSEYGYGKRIEYSNFSQHGRGTRGQITYKTSETTGELVGAISVTKKDELVCITSQGNAMKLKLSTIPVMGKTAKGVRVVNITPPDFAVGMARVVPE